MPKTVKQRALGPETARSHARRTAEGFYARYLSGGAVLDIGFRGGSPDAQPVTPAAIGVELDYPGYDGTTLPFDALSQDAVFASHTLEHIANHLAVLADWFRVLKIGGYLIIAVPHQMLYERKADLPSRFNGDHKRFYTPASLLAEIERALPPGEFRIRSLRDIDAGFSYDTPPDQHPTGCYEIELVLEKIAAPPYAAALHRAPQAESLAAFFSAMIVQTLQAHGPLAHQWQAQTLQLLAGLPLPPFRHLQRHLPAETPAEDIRALLRPLVAAAPFDEDFYLAAYDDIGSLVRKGELASGREHYVDHGYFEGRYVNTMLALFG